MKFFFLTSLLVCLSVSPVRKLADSISSSSVEFAYGYSIDNGKTKVIGEGTVSMQGPSFFMTGNGLEVWCDGSSRWTVDNDAKEVVIESVDESQSPDYIANPALLVGSFADAFKEGATDDGFSYRGRKCIKTELTPVVDAGISSLVLYISEDAKAVYGAEIKMDDGVAVDFTIDGFRLLPQGPAGRFSFDLSSLPSKDYIITDLR